jgi:hypothetical protein
MEHMSQSHDTSGSGDGGNPRREPEQSSGADGFGTGPVGQRHLLFTDQTLSKDFCLLTLLPSYHASQSPYQHALVCTNPLQ